MKPVDPASLRTLVPRTVAGSGSVNSFSRVFGLFYLSRLRSGLLNVRSRTGPGAGAGARSLDEPTAALDIDAEAEVFERVRNLANGKTLLLISHRFAKVRMADRIVVLDRQGIHEDGSHGELMELGGMYAEMFRKQAQGYA